MSWKASAVYENWPANWVKYCAQELCGWKRSSQKLLRHSQIIYKDPALLSSQPGHSLCSSGMNPILSDLFHSSKVILKSPPSPERAFNSSYQTIRTWVALSLPPTHSQVIWLWVRTLRVFLDTSKGKKEGKVFIYLKIADTQSISVSLSRLSVSIYLYVYIYIILCLKRKFSSKDRREKI